MCLWGGAVWILALVYPFKWDIFQKIQLKKYPTFYICVTCMNLPVSDMLLGVLMWWIATWTEPLYTCVIHVCVSLRTA